LNHLLRDWRNLVPVGGLAVLAAVGVFFAFRRKPEDIDELERRRRAYLNRIGRIAEGHVLEIAELGLVPPAGKLKSLFGAKSAPASAGAQASGGRGLFFRRGASVPSATRKLLHYTYAISGVSYETAQDITGLEERLHLSRVNAGQVASVKYDPSNPSNSILLADDWSGLH
jgi:hypothetical protein